MKTKKLAFIAVPVLSLVALCGAFTASGVLECSACELPDPDIAVCYEESSVPDDTLPSGSFFGDGKPRPEPRENDKFNRKSDDKRPDRRAPRGYGEGGDIHFIIYGHIPLPPSPPVVPDDNIGEEVPDGELG